MLKFEQIKTIASLSAHGNSVKMCRYMIVPNLESTGTTFIRYIQMLKDWKAKSYGSQNTKCPKHDSQIAKVVYVRGHRTLVLIIITFSVGLVLLDR